MCPRISIIISSVYDWGKIPFSFDQLEAQHVINTFYGMIATNKNQSASSNDAGHFRGSNYHKLRCLRRFQDCSRTESGTGRKMKKRAIRIAFFLAFLVLLSLVQESHEITGILIPRRIPKCRRATHRRKVRSCRRGTIKSLVPVFVFTEPEIERQQFLR